MLKRVLKFVSKISVRLLLFNILLVFIPIAFLFYLDIYEKKLLSSQEHAMVQQGRIMASALTNKGEGLKIESQSLLDNLRQRQEARIRIIDRDGVVLADSSIVDNDRVNSKIFAKTIGKRVKSVEVGDEKSRISTDSNFLYKTVRASLDILRYFLRGPRANKGAIEYYSSRNMLEGVEVQAALNGRYGATTRISYGGQRSITMYSAIPIYNNEDVSGVVLVSQSTYRILQNLYQIRLEILKVFLICLVAACLISFILSRTIAGPLKRLRNQAKDITDNRGRITAPFKSSKSLDEIGDLNDSLEELTKKLHSHLLQTEAFASDVSHEFKNPLASIQSATELIRGNSCKEQERFIDIISQEVRRLERLVTGVREISGIDAKLSEEQNEIIEPYKIVESILSNFKLRPNNNSIKFKLSKNYTESLKIIFSPERFVQVLENIISNAIDFSPLGGEVVVDLIKGRERLFITVTDEGPGIPEENLNKIFNRFFTYRIFNKKGDRNSGLGLSICDVIIKGYGGNISGCNRPESGAQFKIDIPLLVK